MTSAQVIMLLPYIVKLMELAERVFGDGTGTTKKDLVVSCIGMAVGAITLVSTGGQADWWDRNRESVGAIVDNLASILFPKE
jgi:hypothetical protein